MQYLTDTLFPNGNGTLHGVIVDYVVSDDITIVEIDGTEYIFPAPYSATYEKNYIGGLALLDGVIRLGQSKMNNMDILRFFKKHKKIPAHFHAGQTANADGILIKNGDWRYSLAGFKRQVAQINRIAVKLSENDISGAYDILGGFDCRIELWKNKGVWFFAPASNDLFKALAYQLMVSKMNGASDHSALKICSNCGKMFLEREGAKATTRSRAPRKRNDGTIEPTFCSGSCGTASLRKRKVGAKK